MRCHAHDWRLWMHLAGETPTKPACMFNLVSLKTHDEAQALPFSIIASVRRESSEMLYYIVLPRSTAMTGKVSPLLFDPQIKSNQNQVNPTPVQHKIKSRVLRSPGSINVKHCGGLLWGFFSSLNSRLLTHFLHIETSQFQLNITHRNHCPVFTILLWHRRKTKKLICNRSFHCFIKSGFMRMSAETEDRDIFALISIHPLYERTEECFT